MAIKTLEQRKRQKILLIIGLAILIVAGLVLYFGFWQKKAPTETELLEEQPSVGHEEKPGLTLDEKLRKTELDFSFLTQKIIPFLKIHGNLPVRKGETGRVNPFIPY